MSEIRTRTPMMPKKGNKIHSQTREYLYKISFNDFCKYLNNTISNTQSKIARNTGDKTEKQDKQEPILAFFLI